MNDELKNLVRTCAAMNRERKPGEPPHTLPVEAVTAFVYDLTTPLRSLGDDELFVIEYALGLDGPDVYLRKTALAIRQSLEAMHALALGVFHLLPVEDNQ